MYEVDPAFAPDKLIQGRVYKFRARNFSFGIWNGSSGFIGLRLKFSSVYLFTEYHADTGGATGTVWAIEDYPGQPQAPEGIPLKESLPTRCLKCQGPVKFEIDIPFLRMGSWHHASESDSPADHRAEPYAPLNKELFLWLNQFEEDEDWRAYNAASCNGEDKEAERLMNVIREKRKKEWE